MAAASAAVIGCRITKECRFLCFRSFDLSLLPRNSFSLCRISKSLKMVCTNYCKIDLISRDVGHVSSMDRNCVPELPSSPFDFLVE